MRSTAQLSNVHLLQPPQRLPRPSAMLCRNILFVRTLYPYTRGVLMGHGMVRIYCPAPPVLPCGFDWNVCMYNCKGGNTRSFPTNGCLPLRILWIKSRSRGHHHLCAGLLPMLMVMILFSAVVKPALAWNPMNVGMFPPTAAAKSSINYDGRGFLIDGRRVFIASGSLHYARVPRALWANRLRKMKRAGFNTVQTYIFWSYQERHQGVFNFKGRHNLAAFLHLARRMGFYAILRVGPFCNSEWSQGGWPVWLRFIPGLAVRDDDKPFINALNAYFDKLLPIVAANQISRGGPVLMVQLENEDAAGWGDVLPNGYYKYLYGKARAMGLDVPMFFSGMHHGSSPAGPEPWSTKGRVCPWFTTEMWTGWYTIYRTHPPYLRDLARQAMWHVIAYGGNGYDAYMAAGGVTPSSYVDHSTGPTYDFGAPIGPAGDLRPLYYIYKTANYFARSFQRILETSINVRHLKRMPTPGIRVFERKSPHGNIIFLQNLTSGPVTVNVPGGCPQIIAGGHIFPLIENFAINSTFTLRRGCGRIFGIFKQGAATTLVTYGSPASEVTLSIGTTGTIAAASKAFTTSTTAAGIRTLRVKVPTQGPDIYTITADGKTLRIFVESRAMMRRTWFLRIDGKPALVCGPDYVSRGGIQHGHIWLATRTPLGAPVPAASIYFGDSTVPTVADPPDGSTISKSASWSVPTLASWQVRPADGPARPDYDDKTWIAAAHPEQMGVGDYAGLHQWYRSTVHVSAAGSYRLVFSYLKDTADIFVNGKLVAAGAGKAVDVPLNAGDNSLAIMASAFGRPKLWRYVGPYHSVGAMGIRGSVALFHLVTNQLAVSNWRYRYLHEPKAAAMVHVLSDMRGTPWQDLKGPILPDSKMTGMIWLRAKLPAINADHLVLSWSHARANAFVCFDSGRIRMRAVGHDLAQAMLTFWYGKQPNTISILLPANKTRSLGNIALNVSRLESAGGGDIKNWRMRGGMGSPWADKGWTDLQHAPDVPCFYRTTFQWHPGAGGYQAHAVLRVAWGNLTGGYMWLNGHNLGHYPDTVMPMGVYIPSCYLQSGTNTLTVSDEEGKSPAHTHLVIERLASRWRVRLRTK